MDSLLFSIDLEDWFQLHARSMGHEFWDVSRPVFERQMDSLFGLLDEMRVGATFFMLGITVKNYPDIAREVVSRGHEVACHGYGHERVYKLTADTFRADVEKSIETIQRITGIRPIGYRAPAFSINRDTVWAYDVLADLGFEYDSSLHDSPRIRRRISGIPSAGYRMALTSGRSMWEIPVAVAHFGKWVVPVGGGSYWRVLPKFLLIHGLQGASERGCVGTYLHPYECDPNSLAVPLPSFAGIGQRIRGAVSNITSNIGRPKIRARLREVASRFRLVKYGDAVEQLRTIERSGTRTLSPRGVVV